MKTEAKILGLILMFSTLLVVGAIVILGRVEGNTLGQSVSNVEIDYSRGQKIGSDSAKVKLAEFSDLACPACAAVEPYVKNVLQKYGSNIQFIYFHFPLMQHKNAKIAAALAEEAANYNKFWQIHDRLFETQQQWVLLDNPTSFFLSLAKEAEMDEEQTSKALAGKDYYSKIDSHLALGSSLGVNSTPTLYLNGKKIDLKNFSDIEDAVKKELER